MAQSSKQIQTQGQQQIQTLSPQQILVVKLLELPAVEIEERIKGELLDNPALEESAKNEKNDSEVENKEEDTDYDSLKDYLTEDDIPDYALKTNNYTEKNEEIPFSGTTSFYEILNEQLRELDLTEHEHQISEYLIGSLDDDGFLRKSIDSICDDLELYMGVSTSTNELEKLLSNIQEFEPLGVGARNLKECLEIQISKKQECRSKNLEFKIINEFYEDFTNKNWERIRNKLSISSEEFNAVIKEITKLNPRPGSSLSETVGKSSQQIIPDFIVETFDDGYIEVSLNNKEIPTLHISKSFSEMIEEHTKNKDNQTKESKDAIQFMRQKVDAAKGFIDAVRQRQETLLKTMEAIIEFQKPFFFDEDDSLLKPMILKDIAEITNLDVSTISRVSNSKYVQTNTSIYPLKYFFIEGYKTKDGEELSVRTIKKELQDIIDKENKHKPLSDEELAEMLKDKGYPIARRTVSKYRQQLNLPVARLRRQI